ncbi:MAG: hypothetical protein A2506_05735, partial [Elusimicrobia bacterium RIFOXYD12_FULL_66_9]
LGAAHPVASEIAASCGCRASIIAPDGTLSGDSGLDAAGLARAENHRLRPEVAAALEGREATSVRRSATVGMDLLYAAVPLLRAGRVVGVVRLALPLDAVARRVARTRAFVLLTALAVLIASFAVAWVLARLAGRPLEEMAAAARRLAAGDYSARVRGAEDDERGVLGSALNTLAERVERTVAELSAEKSQLAAVLDQMAEGVVAVDAEGRVLLVNPALSRLLGVDAVAARGRRYLESLRHNGIAELLGSVLSEGRAASREVRLFSPDERVFEGHAAPLLRDGSPSGALLVLHDITRQRRLEQVRRDFVANVGHELRTPLAVALGYLDILLAGPGLDESQRKALMKIQHEDENLHGLVEKLIVFSLVQSPEDIVLDRSELSLADVVDEALKSLGARIEGEGIRVSWTRAEAVGFPGLYADRVLLREAVANLVENAVKFNKSPKKEVRISVSRQGPSLRVTVQDNGPGIPSEEQPKLFRKFYQIDDDFTGQIPGFGLGLAFVKSVAEAHGGEAGLSSVPGGGSDFHFDLPLPSELA